MVQDIYGIMIPIGKNLDIYRKAIEKKLKKPKECDLLTRRRAAQKSEGQNDCRWQKWLVKIILGSEKKEWFNFFQKEINLFP